MLLPLVDKRGDIAMIQIVQTAADQREAFVREVYDRRSEIEFAVEPRLHGVLVGGLNVKQVSGLQRANVIRYDLLSEQIRVLASAHAIRDPSNAEHDRDKDGCGDCQPLDRGSALSGNRLHRHFARKSNAQFRAQALWRSLVKIRGA